jgi:hypothetical protein
VVARRLEKIGEMRARHVVVVQRRFFAAADDPDIAYGGRPLCFLSLGDLIHSKETERTKDWQDVEVLEELFDARSLARVKQGILDPAAALAFLRSRVGLEGFLAAGCLADSTVVSLALQSTVHPVTQALLLPFSPSSPISVTTPAIEPVVVKRLRTVVPTSSLHLTLVEAVRRQNRRSKQEADRKDKEAIRASGPPPQPSAPA